MQLCFERSKSEAEDSTEKGKFWEIIFQPFPRRQRCDQKINADSLHDLILGLIVTYKIMNF